MSSPLDRLARTGRSTVTVVSELGYQASLLAESLVWIGAGRWRYQPVSAHQVVAQMAAMGLRAVPIVAVLALVIGLMLAWTRSRLPSWMNCFYRVRPGRQLGAQRFALHGRVRRMERLLREGRVDIALSIELLVRDQNTGREVIQRRYDVIEPAASERVVDSVKAYESALQAMANRFATDFTQRPPLSANSPQSIGNLQQSVLTAPPGNEVSRSTD